MNRFKGPTGCPDRGPLPQSQLPGRLARLLLAVAVPVDRREAFLGDLIEEYVTVAVPSLGTVRARWWLCGQVARSLVPMFRSRLAREVQMTKWNWLAAGLILGLGLLQAWDSRVHQSTVEVAALVLAALALPVLTALFFRNPAIYVAATLCCAALLLAAKLMSPTPLPALGVVAVLSGGMLASLHGLLTGGGRTVGRAG